MALSQRILGIQPSATMAVDKKAKEMLQRGEDIAAFGVGEPDFHTPDNVKKAAAWAIQNNKTLYTPAGGISELKKAIAAKLKRENNLDYNENNIIVSCGGKHALYNIFQALLNKGDEVIVPKPYWVSYIEQIRLAQGKEVIVGTDEKFKIKADIIEKAITDKTKIIVITSPNNPTGAVVDASELKKIAEIAAKRKIYVISDEVYEHFIYDGGKYCTIASFGDEMKKLALIVNSVSKTYAMTGWRIGYCAGPEEIVKKMTDMQSHVTSNPTSIAQYAAIEALNGPQDSVKMMIKEFDKRRKVLVDGLNTIPGIKCNMPEGAFYAFPDVSGLYNSKVNGSLAFSDFLLEKHKTAVVPGIAFGDDNCVRLSYATSEEIIKKGLERIKKCAEELLGK